MLHATRCSPEDLMSAVCDNRGEGGDERDERIVPIKGSLVIARER